MGVPSVFKMRLSPADHPLVLKSKEHFARLAPTLSIPDSADLTKWFPGVEDQDVPNAEGSCTGFAGAENYEVRFGVTRGYQVPVRGSAEFVYAQERLAMGTFPSDSGGDAATLFSVLCNQGICGVDLCAYDGNPATMPSEAAKQAALANRMHDPCTVPLTPDGFLAVMGSGRPVSIAIAVYQSFVTGVDKYGNVPLPQPGEQLLGYHMLTMMGAQRRWGPYGPNHWGTGWGENGWMRLSWDFIAQCCFEAWAAS